MICSAALDPHGLAKGGGSQWALVTGQVKLNFPGSAINALPLSVLLLDKGNWMGHIFTLSPNMDRAFETPPLCGLQNVEPQKSDPLRRDSKKWQVGKLFPWARHWSLKPEGSESCMQTVLAWTNAIAQLLWFHRNILTSRSLESGSSFLSLSLVIPVAMWPNLNCIFMNQPTNLSSTTSSSTQSRIYHCCVFTKNCICKKRLYVYKISQRPSLRHTSAFGPTYQLLSNSTKISYMFAQVAVVIDR